MSGKALDTTCRSGKTRRMTIREHRERAGMSTGDLALVLGVHVRTVERWEHVPLMPKRALRKRIAALFNEDPSSIDWHVPDAK